MAIEKALEHRVEELTAELQALKARMTRMETLTAGPRLQAAGGPAFGEAAAGAEGEPAFAARAAEHAPAFAATASADRPEEISEEILNWAGRTHLFTRASTLCFLLVVALLLRTITDNKLVDTLVGSGIGMAYAAALMLWGAWRYERKSALAPVFACCGAGLMSVIVLETHTRFASLPLVPAYLTLIATGGAMAFVSYRHRAILPISLGTLGMCLAGAAIDYPHPFFPYLAMILFAANILGFFAARLRSCSWLRWIVLVVTMVMLQFWGAKLGMALYAHLPPTPELAAAWFLPTLALFALLFLAIACAGILRSSGEKIARFDYALPTLNALWSFSCAWYAVSAMGGSVKLLGLIGLLVALGHLGVTFWLTGRKVAGHLGTNSYAFASAALSALALPALTGNWLASLPALCALAFFMSILSRQWQNGGIRLSAYLVQIYAAVALLVALQLNPAAASDPVTALPALLVFLLTLYQYQWCRWYPPPAGSVFSRFDSQDRSAVLLLIASLSSAFLLLKVALLQGVALYADPKIAADVVRCGGSVAVNLAAVGIMFAAYARGSKELRNVAVLVILVGAVKVFLYDLLGTHGLPLVASLFTFGLAALLQSVALGRWKGRSVSF